eukprot:scaffold280577_cov33-Tisochrysis_lutea.AAC.2
MCGGNSSKEDGLSTALLERAAIASSNARLKRAIEPGRTVFAHCGPPTQGCSELSSSPVLSPAPLFCTPLTSSCCKRPISMVWDQIRVRT